MLTTFLAFCQGAITGILLWVVWNLYYHVSDSEDGVKSPWTRRELIAIVVVSIYVFIFAMLIPRLSGVVGAIIGIVMAAVLIVAAGFVCIFEAYDGAGKLRDYVATLVLGTYAIIVAGQGIGAFADILPAAAGAVVAMLPLFLWAAYVAILIYLFASYKMEKSEYENTVKKGGGQK